MSEDEKKSIQIMAISLDSHDESRTMSYQIINQPGKLDFPLLQDIDHKIVDTYGILNPAEAGFKPGIPYPVVYLINQRGEVAHRFLDAEKYHRPANDEVRAAMKKIGWVK